MKAAQLERYLDTAPKKKGWVAISEEVAQRIVHTLERYEEIITNIKAALSE